MKDAKYNGWSNYETWLVSQWIGNDHARSTYWREQAVLALALGDNQYDFTEQVRAEIETASPLAESTGVYAGLLGAAMSTVNWYEIARHLLAEAKEADALAAV